MSIKDYISLYVFLRNMKYELENISFNWHQCQMKLDWLRDLSTNYIRDFRLVISTVDPWLCKWKDSNKNIDSHHSSVDPPAPTILWPRVRIPTATRMLWFINLNSNCNVKNRSGLAHWKKTSMAFTEQITHSPSKDLYMATVPSSICNTHFLAFWLAVQNLVSQSE